jgi:hypothetical protein
MGTTTDMEETMFTLDAFGNRINCRPRLVFAEGGPGGGGDDLDDSKTPQEQGYDFPANTTVKNMTVDEQKEYYRYHARKHENRVKKFGDYDQLKADSDELARLKSGTQTDDEKEQQAAIENARREGENIGSERYLVDAVKANFRVATQLTVEEADAAFEHIDAKSFLDDKGNINHAALTTFAEAFAGSGDGKNTPPPSRDPVEEALRRQRQAKGGEGKTMSDLRQETRESFTRTKK